MRKKSVLKEKSKKFELRVIGLYKYLCNDKKELVLSKQVLRSGTSIGANISESAYAQSKAELIVGLASKSYANSNVFPSVPFSRNVSLTRQWEDGFHPIIIMA